MFIKPSQVFWVEADAVTKFSTPDYWLEHGSACLLKRARGHFNGSLLLANSGREGVLPALVITRDEELVEAAGIEPASASTLPLALHA